MKRSLKQLRALAALLIAGLILASQAVSLAAANSAWPQRIKSFERADPVYSATVPLGTAVSALTLPDTLRAVLPLPDGADPGAFVQADPSALTSAGGQTPGYAQYGYAAPDNAADLYSAGSPVVYTLNSATDAAGPVAYRVYGSLGGGDKQWYASDASGKVTGLATDVPVTWTCDNYDGNTQGEYTFSATLDGYMFGGARPFAKITVSGEAPAVTPPPEGPSAPGPSADPSYDGPALCTCLGGADRIHDQYNPDCPLFGKDTEEVVILKTGERVAMAAQDAGRILAAQAQGVILYPGMGAIALVPDSFQSGLGFDKSWVIL